MIREVMGEVIDIHGGGRWGKGWIKGGGGANVLHLPCTFRTGRNGGLV